MQQNDIVYEKRIIQDQEFPVEIFVSSRKNHGERTNACIPHWHEHLELHYLVEGELEIVMDHKAYILKKGDMAIINGNVVHVTYYKEDMRELILIFDMKDLTKEEAEKNVIFRPLILQDEFIGSIMEDILHEYPAKEAGYRLICKGQIFRLIAYLTRNYVESMMTEKESLRHRKKLERLNVVKQYIGEHFAEQIENETLAELIHLSEDRFNHLFKECVGVSPRRYVNEVRLNEALQLLRTGEYLSSQAAEMAGFTDYNYFGRLFRQTYGCTPSEISGNPDMVEKVLIKIIKTAK